MIDYLKNLLPRLSKYSESLDKLELFVDHPWVFIDEDNNKHQYIFQRNGNLIMSMNGKGQNGKWEYISTAKSLWIDRGVDKILLNQGFIDKGVMILKKDTLISEPFMLVNLNIITDLDVKGYLENLIAKKENDEYTILVKSNLYLNFILLEGGGRLLLSKKYNTGHLDTLIGIEIKQSLCQVQNGEYRVVDGNTILVIENSVIKNYYTKKVFYETSKGVLIIYQKSNNISNGDKCILNDNQNATDYVKLINPTEIDSISIKNGKIDFAENIRGLHIRLVIIIIYVSILYLVYKLTN